ncbi:thiamine pyrophosphate-binding protein [Pseudomonas sp. NA-150]|uniref:thiamine pyrophosphate-binding protein n=1 Tax=Pseudomonas sp. NA-150 TaxID=3367525 RepID=UPI0037C7967D
MASQINSVGKLNGRRGAEVLLETLASEGVEYIFGNPGTTELPLMDALSTSPGLSYILALQEASAVAMADGYAQAAKKPGFLNLHTAGGLGHGMGNLLNASVAHVPLVVTAGQQDSRHSITDPLLLGDLVSIARPAVKWAYEVTRADQLPVILRRAFHDSTAAPSGPVFLSLPMNVMEEMSTVCIGEPSIVDDRTLAGSLPKLAQLLAQVKPGRLALIAGDEIYQHGASQEVVALAELLGAPVYGSSWPSRIPFPTSHALWAGNLPTKSTEIAATLANYDALFALGGKSLITILYSEGSAVPKGCEVYQLSSDVTDLGRTYATKLSVMGDISLSLKALYPLLAANTEAQLAVVRNLRQKAGVRRENVWAELNNKADADSDLATISPLLAAREAMRAIGPRVPIVDEALATTAHIRSFLRSGSSDQYSFFRGGGLGWGMPAAVGVSLGLGREPVVSLVGDGAAMYSPQALWTAAHERLPITFIVMNNREYNVLKKFMKSQAHYLSTQSNQYIAMELNDPAIDYVALAQSMGVEARRVVRAGDVAPAVAAGIASGRPNLIEIMISKD